MMVALVGMVGWGAVRACQPPEAIAGPVSRAEGLTAQQKLYDLITGGGAARRGGTGPVVLSEGEIGSFLARHLGEAADLPLADLRLRLPASGVVEVTGRMPLRTLLTEVSLATPLDLLPGRWGDRPMWLRVRGIPQLDTGPSGRRYLRLDVQQFHLGRQRLPAFLLRLLLSPTALRVFRWPLPDTIDSIAVEPGRVLIRARS